MRTATEQYEIWLRRRRLAEATIRTYIGEVRAYQTWAREHGEDRPWETDHFSDEAVRRYIDWIVVDRERAPKGAELALTALRAMWRSQGRSLDVRLPAGRHPSSQRRSLVEEEVEAVWRTALKRGPRDTAIIAVLLGSGTRLQECEALDVHDVDIDEAGATLHVRAAEAARAIPVDDRTRDALERWLEDRSRYRRSEVTPAFFLSVQGFRLSRRSFRHIAAEVGRSAGVMPISPRVLRRAYAENLRRSGLDPRDVTYRLGTVR